MLAALSYYGNEIIEMVLVVLLLLLQFMYSLMRQEQLVVEVLIVGHVYKGRRHFNN